MRVHAAELLLKCKLIAESSRVSCQVRNAQLFFDALWIVRGPSKRHLRVRKGHHGWQDLDVTATSQLENKVREKALLEGLLSVVCLTFLERAYWLHLMHKRCSRPSL